MNGCVQVTWDPIILWLELVRASIFHYVLWTSFKGLYSQQVEGLRVEAFWIPLLAISNDLARLWSHVRTRGCPGLEVEDGGHPGPDSSTFLWTQLTVCHAHLLCFPGHTSSLFLFFFFSDSHCSYLECPFVPFCLYKVYIAFIISQDESWRVIEFYDRKGTKPSSSKAPRGC